MSTFRDFLEKMNSVKNFPKNITVKTDVPVPQKAIDAVYKHVESFIDEKRQDGYENTQKTDVLGLKEEVKNFIASIMRRGTDTKGDLLGRKEGSQTDAVADMTPEYTSTAYWTVRIMKNLYLDTADKDNIKKFEKQITDIAVKELKEAGIKIEK